jgi:hypothetical protein
MGRYRGRHNGVVRTFNGICRGVVGYFKWAPALGAIQHEVDGPETATSESVEILAWVFSQP